MKTLLSQNGMTTITLKKIELAILINALNEVTHGFEVNPFDIRIGGTKKSAEVLLDRIDDIYNQSTDDLEQQLELKLSVNDLNMIKNAMIEVCKYLEDWEFQTRTGFTRQEVQTLIEEINKIIQQ